MTHTYKGPALISEYTRNGWIDIEYGIPLQYVRQKKLYWHNRLLKNGVGRSVIFFFFF